MNVKLKGNQTRENLIFSVKQLTVAYEYEMSEQAFYHLQDLVIASAQDNHKDLVQALNGLMGTLDNGDMLKACI